jgi:hypothetical protein
MKRMGIEALYGLGRSPTAFHAHTGDCIELDQILAGFVDLPGISVDDGSRRRLNRQAVDRGPLLDDFMGVGRNDRLVDTARSDRKARPWPFVMWRRERREVHAVLAGC